MRFSRVGTHNIKTTLDGFRYRENSYKGITYSAPTTDGRFCEHGHRTMKGTKRCAEKNIPVERTTMLCRNVNPGPAYPDELKSWHECPENNRLLRRKGQPCSCPEHKPAPVFELRRDGKLIMTGTEQECWHHIHWNHSFSVSHAIAHEGYSITEVSK